MNIAYNSTQRFIKFQQFLELCERYFILTFIFALKLLRWEWNYYLFIEIKHRKKHFAQNLEQFDFEFTSNLQKITAEYSHIVLYTCGKSPGDNCGYRRQCACNSGISYGIAVTVLYHQVSRTLVYHAGTILIL